MEAHGVTVRSVRALRGPNVFAYMPVLHIKLDIGTYEDRPSTAFPGFADRITAFLLGLHNNAVPAAPAALSSDCAAGHILRTFASMSHSSCRT